MITTPFLKAQNDILEEMESLARNFENERWEDEEVYDALNQVLSVWWDNVMIQQVYTISGGWVSGTYEYSLPSYITEPIRPQVLRTRPIYPDLQIDDTTSTTWVDIPGYTVIPDGSGGLEIKLTVYPFSLDGQVLYWVRNGPVPWPIPKLNAQLASGGSSLVLSTVIDCGDVGWVKINEEWIFYAGVTRSATTTTLSGLRRAENSTTAATHSANDPVYFGVAANTRGLWRQLTDQMLCYMHEMFLADAAPRERDAHERMVSFYQNRIERFWDKYAPPFTPQVRLTVRGIGAVD